MLYYERQLKEKGYDLIIGVDEAGRGPLAGPVAAAAVALLTTRFENRIDDSKKLTPLEREKAFPEIIKNSIFGIAMVDEKTIDRLNILEATRIAMEQAVSSLVDKLKKDCSGKKIHIIVDGNMTLNVKFPFTSIIRGDAKSMSIACASILAKVSRDRVMAEYDLIYPEYGFIRHKGYPTAMHRQALRKFGPSKIHRVSFNGV